MMTPAHAIATYIRAKDGNRPHLMVEAFSGDAVLEMVVKTGAISFPPRVVGLRSITDVLVRNFSQTFENVYTLCLGPAPIGLAREFECAWLVVMSERASNTLRVGCGRYSWRFQDAPVCVANHLRIVIEHMEVLPSSATASVMQWVSTLPYPWCPSAMAAKALPESLSLSGVAGFIESSM